ncbi:8-amino-7-oxononanoate synthase [Lentisphaerota bacterium WC36G]|nr:8-amino-7-oxononanoate synthase [Lentisphaerae bacterium WC36]
MNNDKCNNRKKTPEFIQEFLRNNTIDNAKRRELRGMQPVNAREIILKDANGVEKKCLNFSSNDYLGLNFNSEVVAEAKEWANKFGAGSGASRLVTGTVSEYLALEERIALWKNAPAAMIIGSGYMANVGLLQAITDRKTLILADRLNHASLNLGCQQSGGKFIRYQHNDLSSLLQSIERFSDRYERKVIVSDTVFSMDGDVGYIDELHKTATENDAILYLDDAHASGVLGEYGKGLATFDKCDLAMGTFSKALGAYGAYVACSEEFKQYFINKCGSFIYSTALPPAAYGAISAAVRLVQSTEFDEKRAKLFKRVNSFKDELKASNINIGNSTTQIVPVIVGDSAKAMEISEKLLTNDNILAVAIRPPTVPKGTARLRIIINTDHTDDDINLLTEKVIQYVKE